MEKQNNFTMFLEKNNDFYIYYFSFSLKFLKLWKIKKKSTKILQKINMRRNQES